MPARFVDVTGSIEDILAALVEDEKGCLVWPYGKSHGYGSVQMGAREFNGGVHILAWSFINGPVPDGLDLHHRCENKACGNVEHLEALTPKEHSALHMKARNLKRMTERGPAVPRHRKSLQIDPEVYAEISELAYQRRTSVNTEIGRAVLHWLGLSKEDRERILVNEAKRAKEA